MTLLLVSFRRREGRAEDRIGLDRVVGVVGRDVAVEKDELGGLPRNGMIGEEAANEIIAVADPLFRNIVGRQQKSRVLDATGRDDDVFRLYLELVPGERRDIEMIDTVCVRR